MSDRVVRGVVGAGGLGLLAWGAWLLLDLDGADLTSAGIWVIGGIVIHDFVLAPLSVVVALAAARVVPRHLWPTVAGALAIWAVVTVVAFPVLSGMGGKADNDTILVHPYRAWWLALTLVLAAVTVALAVVRHRRAGGGTRTRTPEGTGS